jgi:hypothetical protein
MRINYAIFSIFLLHAFRKSELFQLLSTNFQGINDFRRHAMHPGADDTDAP